MVVAQVSAIEDSKPVLYLLRLSRGIEAEELFNAINKHKAIKVIAVLPLPVIWLSHARFFSIKMKSSAEDGDLSRSSEEST